MSFWVQALELLQLLGALRGGDGAPWHSHSGGRCWSAGAAAPALQG